jgi:hypothetical protein
MYSNCELDTLGTEVQYRTQPLEVVPVIHRIDARSECAATLPIPRRRQRWCLISDQAIGTPRSPPQHVY